MFRVHTLLGIIGFTICTFIVAEEARSAGKVLKAEQAISGSYIVVFNDGSVATLQQSESSSVLSARLASKHKVHLTNVYEHALTGFSMNATEEQAQKIAGEPNVKYVIQDGIVSISNNHTTQNGATWGLDRIDQRNRPLNGTYMHEQTGVGVNVYVIDTGIRVTHQDFGGRAVLDFTSIQDGNGLNDCNGHGTHVAGTIGGTVWGVAKRVRLHSVRVLDCAGSGSNAGIIAGIDWVTANRILPAVANMSLGGGAHQAMDDAVTRSIERGVVYVVAAGNDNESACINSPARTPRAITVGATNSIGARWGQSNFGRCVDIFAPGVNITSAGILNDNDRVALTGTSMASPHVAGVAALILQTNITATPEVVTSRLVGMMTFGLITQSGTRSPNHLLYSRPSTTNRGAFFRYFKTNTINHFYTMNWNELSAAGFSSWNYEGVAGYLARTNIANTAPLYRYFNTLTNKHFYTTNYNELGGGGTNGWIYEGVAGFVPTVVAADTTNLYRYFNTITGDRLYTTNWGELGSGGTNGWVYEGVQCQVFRAL